MSVEELIDNLLEIDLYNGKYDPHKESKDFMNGVCCVMEEMIALAKGNEEALIYMSRFMRNLTESEQYYGKTNQIKNKKKNR